MDEQKMHELYKDMYKNNVSSRVLNEGNSGIYIRYPQFVGLFTKRFGNICNKMNVLEMGGGLGW